MRFLSKREDDDDCPELGHSDHPLVGAELAGDLSSVVVVNKPDTALSLPITIPVSLVLLAQR